MKSRFKEWQRQGKFRLVVGPATRDLPLGSACMERSEVPVGTSIDATLSA